MKKFSLFIFVLIFSFCKKENKEKPIITDFSMIELNVIPSFYGEKKFILNIEQRQLLFKNLTNDVNDFDENHILEASENRLFRLTQNETDSLLLLCKNIKGSKRQNDNIAPDQWGFHGLAVKKNKDLIEIQDGSEVAGLMSAIVHLIRKKSNDEKVLFELKRY